MEILQEDFFVYGMKEDETFEDFIIGEDYLGFLITRKNKNILEQRKSTHHQNK